MRKKTNLDLERAMAVLSYDPGTGLFRWLIYRSPTCKVGCIAGTVTRFGYRRITIGRQQWMAHNLAWAFCHGSVPAADIDHINRNRDDNRITNLRLATRGQNNLNSSRWSERGELLGVTPARNVEGRWIAQISIEGENTYLGRFDTEQEARKAYLRAAKRRPT